MTAVIRQRHSRWFRRSSRTSLYLGCMVFLVAGLPIQAGDDQDCLKCHDASQYKAVKPGEEPPPFVDPKEVADSVHGRNGVACDHCHTEADEVPHPKQMSRYTCSDCHKNVSRQYKTSIHGQAREQQITEAATCIDCHGGHDMHERTDPRSRTHASNVEKTCLRCHTSDEMAQRFGFTRQHIGADYDQSIHARVMAAGHTDAATCNDCHGSHEILPSREPGSWVNRNNIPRTCGKCHWIVLDQYKESIHGQNFARGSADAPVCNSCHRDHRVLPVTTDLFKLAVVADCGHCHENLLKSYRLSYHGKITQLGGTVTARCSDCHGYHQIKAVHDPRSRVAAENVVTTCRRCHHGANANFAQYQPHADYLDRERFPIIFYTWLAMILLLTGTLSFFTLHTFLWFVRSTLGRWREAKNHNPALPSTPGRYVRRFSLYHRLTHGLVIVSFLGLTLTGFPLKYSYMDWAHRIFDFLGGFRMAGTLHRFFAILSFAYVAMHLVHLGRVWRRRGKQPFFRAMFGPNSMVLNWGDLKQFFQHVRWFLFLGPRPRFDRWTYWEKFDYWGEIWGITVIGVTGLMLWLPLLVSRLLPGWIFNVATVVHSIEALLAAGVIFTVHFFNAHIHPDKFPMDDVIFTGTLPEHQFAEERPAEYERLRAEGRLEEILADPPSRRRLLVNRVLGFAALSIGVALIVCVIYAEIHQHFLT